MLLIVSLSSETMSNIDQQSSSLGSFPTFPSLYPHFNQPSGFWLWVKPCLVGDIGKYLALGNSQFLADAVVGRSGGEMNGVSWYTLA